MVDESDPFRRYHWHAAWMRLARRSAVAAGVAALLTGLSLLVGAAPAQEELRAPPLAGPIPGAIGALDPATLPQPVERTPVSPTPAVTPLPLTGTWSIDIDTTGHQAEVDACLWVRMDLGAVAPIVGAHNYCGGEIVLRMAIGDMVELHGTSLDGVYVVSESRDAWAGDRADAATSGMTAAVILQTCYWNSGGKERLLALIRA